VYLLARNRKKPRTFVVLAGYGSADRAGVSLQIYECLPIDFRVSRTGARATTTTRIQTARSVRADCDVRSLHDSADRLECATRLDYAGGFAIAGESRPGLWLASDRGALIPGSTSHRLFASALPGVGLGCDSKLAAHQSTIQNSFPDVVRFASVCFLLASILEQKRCSELGWPCVLWFRISRDIFLVGTRSDERSFTDMRWHCRRSRVDHERSRIEHRFAAGSWLSAAAKRSE